MSVVKINAIEVPDGMGPELELRFAERARVVETRGLWGEVRVGSDAFRQGHARAESTDGRPVAAHPSLLQFEVVLQVAVGAAPRP